MILFDITRLLVKRNSSSPSGIDRVSFQYLHYFLTISEHSICFLQQKDNAFYVVDNKYTEQLYQQLMDNWISSNIDEEKIQQLATDVINFPQDHKTLLKDLHRQHKSSGFSMSDEDMIEQFYKTDYESRLLTLQNADLSRLIDKNFNWFEKIPNPVKLSIFSIAARSRWLARLLIKIGRAIGYLKNIINIKEVKQDILHRIRYRKNKKLLEEILQNTDLTGSIVYINTSHHMTLSNNTLKKYKELFDINYVFFMHDLFAIEKNEYFTKRIQTLFSKFLDTAFETNASFLINSNYTKRCLEEYMQRVGKKEYTKCIVNYIGVDDIFYHSRGNGVTELQNRYFVIVSTIEPRKNHLLLLKIWQRFYDSGIQDIPKLFIVGNRGWKNEQIINMLESSPGLSRTVYELNHINDALLKVILCNARALLFPSFHEGWGMPVVEALSMQVPVICSNIPALRESGQDIPEYIDPQDSLKWEETIVDYSMHESKLRNLQLERIREFKKPTWDQHFTRLQEAL